MALISRLASTNWRARRTTLRATTHSTAKNCAPVWCCSALNISTDLLYICLRIVTECLNPSPTEYLSVLAVFSPAELRRKAATLTRTSVLRAKPYTSQLYQQTND